MKYVGGRSLISFYEIFYQILKVVYSFLWPLFMNQLLILIDPDIKDHVKFYTYLYRNTEVS